MVSSAILAFSSQFEANAVVSSTILVFSSQFEANAVVSGAILVFSSQFEANAMQQILAQFWSFHRSSRPVPVESFLVCFGGISVSFRQFGVSLVVVRHFLPGFCCVCCGLVYFRQNSQAFSAFRRILRV